jgi:hypothetical protein
VAGGWGIRGANIKEEEELRKTLMAQGG